MCPIENVASRTREQSRPSATCWWQETSWFLDESSATLKLRSHREISTSGLPVVRQLGAVYSRRRADHARQVGRSTQSTRDNRWNRTSSDVEDEITVSDKVTFNKSSLQAADVPPQVLTFHWGTQRSRRKNFSP